MSVRSILPYLVEEYKYLCCIVDEHGQCRRVVKERAKAGACRSPE